MKFLFPQVFILSFIVNLGLLAQENIAIGTWRSHLSHHSSTALAVSGSNIFSGSKSGLFYYESEFNSVHPLSKINGYADISVTLLEYAVQSGTLIIVYSDGNIDLVRGGKTTNLAALKNARINTSKSFHHIFVDNSSAYIATSFGLALLDLNAQEIKEIYQNIGINGDVLEVFSSTRHNDSIFIASKEGLKKASLDPRVNLQDFNYWKTVQATPTPSGLATRIASYNNNVYVGFSGNGIYNLTGNTWSESNLPVANEIRNITVSGNKLLISMDESILAVSSSSYELIEGPEVQRPFNAQFDENGSLWIADSSRGLLKYESQKFHQIIPNGPSTGETQRVISIGNKVVGLPGGFSSSGAPKGNSNGFFVFESGTWSNFNPQSSNPSYRIPAFKDFIASAFDSENQIYYLGSFENGVIGINSDNSHVVYNHSNSPLTGEEGTTRVSDLKVDFEGALWIVNYDVPIGQPSLVKKGIDGSWESYFVNNPLAAKSVQLELDNYGNKWLRVNPATENTGVLVYNESSNKVIQLNTRRGFGGLVNAQVNDIALDADGAIWLATNNGISVFYSSYDVFEGNIDATRPIFENQYLLKDSKVTTIEIDNGGRKWIGTENGGVYLFNSDVSKLLYHFTVENSPLPTNNILDIAINATSGEVFFASALGIMSFRADATESAEGISKVKVFPNPVTPQFRGTLGISGLVENTSVKITDVSGRLIYKTVSNGGTASWEIGSKSLRTGVYYVFAVSESGEEQLVSKFAVIE